MHWPKKLPQPFGIESDYSWSDIGAIFKIIGDYKIGLFLETGVNKGDLASWMLAKSLFVSDFHYIGITNDLNILDERLEELIKHTEQSFISVGKCCSKAIISRARRIVRNSIHPVMVFCDGQEVEKEFITYFDVLRPGDVIASYRFPYEFHLNVFKKLEELEKVERIGGDGLKNTSIIAGVLI